jgi:hypothetical protein
MQSRIGMAIVAVAVLAGVSITALGQTDSGGVTVIRGGKAQTQSAGDASINPTEPTGGAVIDRSGDLNARRTGSANAGGEIATPPPGLAGEIGSSIIDRSGDLNARRTGSANAGGIIANPPPGFAGQ